MNFNNSVLEKWESKSLNDVCLKITSGGTPSRKNNDFYTNGTIFWVKTKELNNWYLDNTEEMITENAIKNSSAKILPKNTILLAMYGATVGELGILKSQMACNQACCALIIDDSKADYRFVFYLLRLFKDRIKGLATGAAQQNLSATVIKEFYFDYPSLLKQKEIADILESLDKKIHLNQQTNQTLEHIAQAIFKSWFVDFDPVRAKADCLANGGTMADANLSAMGVISGKSLDKLAQLQANNPQDYDELWQLAEHFPCELVENAEFGEVPKGWETSTIGESYNVVMGQSPNGESYNEQGNGTLFYQGRAEFGWRFPSPRLFTTEPKRMAKVNDILMSVRAPVGDLNVALENCCIGRGLCALSHKSEVFSFGFYQMKNLKSLLDVFNGEGTVFGSINQKDLKSIQVLNPDKKMILMFDKFICSIDKQIKNNTQENLSLTKIRDELLPKLLSGELLNE